MHSLQKGAASYVSSGSTCGPPQVATIIRAGWTIFEAAGNHYVGRVVSGHPIRSPKFIVLPAQFDCCAKIVMPSIPTGLTNADRFLSASLIFQLDKFENYLHPSHPLLNSSFLSSETVMEIKMSFYLKYTWEEEEDGVDKTGEDSSTISRVAVVGGLSSDGVTNQSFTDPSLAAIKPMPLRGDGLIRKATGIPMHVILSASMQKIINAQHVFLLKMTRVVNEEFDKREVGHRTFQVQKQVQDILTSFEENVITKLEGLGGESRLTNKNQDSSTPTNISGGKRYHWGRKYRRVPYDWTFPNKITLCTAMHWWFLVDEAKEVCPPRYLTSTDLHNCKNGRRNLSNLKTIMTTLIN